MSSAPIPINDAAVSLAFVGHARNYLIHHYLPKIERCLERLTDDQIWWRPNSESNSIGNLVLHLCGNARQWIIAGVNQTPDARKRDKEFQQVKVIPANDLVTLLRETLFEIDLTLTDLDPTSLLAVRRIQGLEVNVLEAIFHVTEHFSMHTGQIIMLTKMLTQTNLSFYDFSTGVPVHSWEE
ncbi:MAG TPA: DinB family protein [Pyrinomonadaceae bacterium]|nr:DinB family protein [Pyrinomonadaceae bacterium]